MSNIFTGLKVIDCATYIAAPAAATALADFGAEVIKIERPPYGDPYRYIGQVPGMGVSEHPYCWILENRSKRSIALDFGKEAAREVLYKLIESADVFITNYQPQLLRKFKLEYETLRAINPRLIFAQVTGYGETGVDAETPGFDASAYWARSGLMGIIHNAGADPATSPCGFGDHPTSMALYGAIVTALYQRLKTGEGMKVSTALIANGVWSNACQIQGSLLGAKRPARWSRSNSINPLVNHYLTRDGKRMLFVFLVPGRDWINLCDAIGQPELADDPRFNTFPLRTQNSATLVAILDEAIGSQPLEEWRKRFATRDLIWGLVPDLDEVAADPQLVDAGSIATIDDFPGGPRKTVSNPMSLNGVAKEPPRYAPGIGQHTLEILSQTGYSQEEIASLLDTGAALQQTKG
jgi:crotonobetainyl-CoA:carnitine CoA-transferase CaiB-like acyl-CoA transferase